ncbi:DUF1217 domain-containing protein (plasmid) [Aristophania vespae]|uniref:DUF1217 domain-containing protein n=1 Tax=Aristophania vespae TaxID=2697033 RepID=A0A6P1NDU0_9PROT|nr:DUF1217 domain-containing protein [Aristophania vespae]QHI96486.1 DUF1217 domain-containing protein [Aristophania vespae]UMM64828.1 hypothetical protein DM15PD_18480 [Aristophania vespae]
MGLGSLSPVAQYITAVKDEQKVADIYVKTDATTKRYLEDFRKKAPSITTPKQLMDDFTSNKVVLEAYNLGSVAKQPALEKKLLTENPHYHKALAATSKNAAWLAFADAFDKIRTKTATLNVPLEPEPVDTTSPTSSGAYSMTPDFIEATAKSYELRQYENSKDLQKSGVGNALYFTRTMQSGKIKDINDLMSDATIMKVVEAVNGYNPDQFAALDFQQQQRIMKQKVDLKEFTDADGNPDAKKIQRYAERYLTVVQLHPEYNQIDQPANIMDLFGGDTGEDGILALFV